MDRKTVEQILKSMEKKTTEELTKILHENDKSQWSEEAFEAIKQVLSKRTEAKTKVQELLNHKNIEDLIRIITASDVVNYSDDERREAAKGLGRLNALEAVPPLLKVVNDQ